MANEEITIPRVYLKDEQFWKSAHHTAYCTSRATPIAPGEDPPLMKMEFWFGIARHVPSVVYDAFKAAGIATTDRPIVRPQDDV